MTKESVLTEVVDIGFAMRNLDFMEENDMRTPLDPPSLISVIGGQRSREKTVAGCKTVAGSAPGDAACG